MQGRYFTHSSKQVAWDSYFQPMESLHSIEETMSEVICHALRRTDQLNTGDQLAIGQEYREWIQCVKNRELIPQDILFINTSTFGKKFQQRDRVVTYTERGLPHLYRGEKMQIVKSKKQSFTQGKTSPGIASGIPTSLCVYLQVYLFQQLQPIQIRV